MMNENVIQLLEKCMWNLATCADGEPNVVPVLFKKVTEDGKLIVADVFMEATPRNIAQNENIAVSACDEQSLEGYQIKGKAQYVTEGPVVEAFKAIVEEKFNGAATAKGVVIIDPEKVIVTTPGADNKKVL